MRTALSRVLASREARGCSVELAIPLRGPEAFCVERQTAHLVACRGGTGGLTMTYQNDPNSRIGMREDRSYTGWIVGGVVALAVILGIFMMTGRNNDNTANNTMNRPSATVPTTTGSAVPAPSSGQGTAGDNRQNPPAPVVPAR
jgi:hypothetical protein